MIGSKLNKESQLLMPTPSKKEIDFKRYSEMSIQKILKIKDSTNLTPVKSLTKFLSPFKMRDKIAEYNQKIDSQRKVMLREVNESIT